MSCVQSVMDETWLFTNFLMLQKSIWMLLLTNALLNVQKIVHHNIEIELKYSWICKKAN